METNKVVWSEGMFLSPQHFQQQERYIENYTHQYIDKIVTGFYGFTLLHIDRSMLNIGKIVVSRAEGIFPDGTPFELHQSLVLDVPQNTHSKTVFLALPLKRAGVVDVGEGHRFRHSSYEYDLFDTSRDQSDALLVELAQFNLSLKLEGDDLQDHALLSVSEILEHKPDGSLVLNQAFIPHCLHVGVSHYLMDTLSDLYTKIQYRARAISIRLESDSKTKSYQASMRDLLWLQLLGYWMPLFEQWYQTPTLLTKDLYSACISMVGQMQGLEGNMPSSFALWNPNALYGIFSDVFSELQMNLRESQVDNVVTLQWDMQLFLTRRLLRTLIKDRALFNQGRFILVVTSSIGISRLSEEFPKSVKLSGNSDIVGLVRNALSGVPLRHLPYAPTELKSRNDAAYFEVDTESKLWMSLVKKEEAIALHVDEKIEDIHIEFHVIR